MVLHAEDGQSLVPQAFKGLIVEVDMAELDVGGQSGGSTAKPWFWVVISILPVCSLRTGWLAPRWPNLSLNVLPPNAWPRIWWPEADAEDGDARATRRPCESESRSVWIASASATGIAGAIGEKNAVWLMLEDRLGGHRCREPP